MSGFRKYYTKPAGKSEPRFKAGRNPDYLRWIRGLPCCVSGVRFGEPIDVPFPGGKIGKVCAIIEAAHVRTRGAGAADVGEVVPLEMSKHREQHKIGIKTFQRKYQIDLADVAQKLARQYKKVRRV